METDRFCHSGEHESDEYIFKGKMYTKKCGYLQMEQQRIK
jgi:hypothetical protein